MRPAQPPVVSTVVKKTKNIAGAMDRWIYGWTGKVVEGGGGGGWRVRRNVSSIASDHFETYNTRVPYHNGVSQA